MSRQLHAPAILFLLATAIASGQSFSDDFNRPNGGVGNGWTTWGAGAQILGAQLETFGQNTAAGGIARSLPVTFPLTFSFDFRTDAPGGLDGGWTIGFNGQNPGFPLCCPHANNEFALWQFSGTRPLGYHYETSTGPKYVEVPLVAGQEEYQSGATSHIAGTVHADLSSSVTITYPDGRRVTIATPAPPGDAIRSPQGSYLNLGNGNETVGPHYFDNIRVAGGCQVEVPKWYQGTLQKPAPSDSAWQCQDYDHDLLEAGKQPPPPTGDSYGCFPSAGYNFYRIHKKGCALTAAAMALRSLGATLDPGTLNDGLKSWYKDFNGNGRWDPGPDVTHPYTDADKDLGYKPGGDFRFDTAVQLSGLQLNSLVLPGFDPPTVDAELCSGRPVVVGMRNSAGTHFVVVTGKTSGDYNVNDPGARNVTTLNGAAGTVGSLQRWGMAADQMYLFQPPNAPLPSPVSLSAVNSQTAARDLSSLLIHASDNVDVLAMDPLGRRVGSTGGTPLLEVPGSSYSREGIALHDDDGISLSPSDSFSLKLYIPKPVTGTYSLTITGVTAGPGTISVYPNGALGAATTVETVPTNLAPGQRMQYSTSYSVPAVTPPFGVLDVPNATTGLTNLAGAFNVGGWALSPIALSNCPNQLVPGPCLGIYREPVGSGPTQANGLVFLANAFFLSGARPDVAAKFTNYPNNKSAGWGMQVLTNGLPGTNGQLRGNGNYKLHAIATDEAGLSTDVGTVSISVNNAASNLPFGTIDTPAQGATVSGTAYVNFAWVLTPQPSIIPIDGSTITVYIDDKPVGHPTYNFSRCDVDFQNLRNSGSTDCTKNGTSPGPVGLFNIDTTKLTNGLHTIQWGVGDSGGHVQGIGSRFFIVQN